MAYRHIGINFAAHFYFMRIFQACKLGFVALFWLMSLAAFSQDTLQLMHFNCLKWPGSTGPTRLPLFANVFGYVKPDILTVNEMLSETGAQQLLTDALNINGETRYQRARYTNGPDTENMLFFRSDKLGLKGQRVLQTAPRWTCGYTLYLKTPGLAQGDTIFINYWIVHLQASQGTTQEAARNTQVTAIRNAMNAMDTLPNFFLAGDFNIYTSAEAAYQTALSAGRGQFFDPINRPGTWHSNSTFADIHTQSPRTTQFGGGSNGGLDDRFDFILCTQDVINGTNRVQILPNTYKPLGNDGLRFNNTIVAANNTSAPQNIIQSIHDASDHLPVITKLKVASLTGSFKNIRSFQEMAEMATFNPAMFSIRKPELTHWVITNSAGAQLASGTSQGDKQVEMPDLSSGIYFLRIANANGAATQRFAITLKR